MPVMLAAMSLYVLIGLASTRFGKAQRVASLAIATTMTLLYFFVEGMM